MDNSVVYLEALSALAPFSSLFYSSHHPWWTDLPIQRGENEILPGLKAYHLFPKAISSDRFEYYYRLAYREAYFILKNHDDACEAVAETVFRVSRVPTEPKAFERYLCIAVRNVAYNKLKQRQRQYKLQGEYKILAADSQDLSVTQPIDQIIQEEQAQNVRNAIAKLKCKDREIIVLHYYDNLSCPEIADLLNMSVKAVESKLYRARQKLRKILIPAIA